MQGFLQSSCVPFLSPFSFSTPAPFSFFKALGDGDYFGELALLFAKPRTASVRAVGPCDLFVLEQADFNRVVEAHPEFAASLEEVAKKYPA